MTPLFPAQRAAEEFASVLEGRATVDVAERYAGMVDTVQVLREQPAVTPRADFVAELRVRLMTAAETELVAAPPVVRRLPSRSSRNRRLGTAAAALVFVGGSAGMAAAASGSLPGESLYPIKRGVEQVTIAAHLGDSSKGSALLDQAGERLDEVEGLVSSGSSTALVDATVDDFRTSANSGADKLFRAYQTDGDSADVTAVRDFTASAMDQISSVAPGNDPAVASALRDAADVVADIDQQATILCATCGGGGDALTPPDALASGAAAGTVANLISRPARQASVDIETVRAARAAAAQDELDGLTKAAQGVADDLGRKNDGLNGVTGPLTSTLTSSGQLVPNLTTNGGAAVKNLVGGLTGTIDGVTGGGGGDGGLGDTASGAGGAVDDAVDGVTGTVDDLTGDLLPEN